jgi:putative transposase
MAAVIRKPSPRAVAWKLCETMKAQDVTATLDLALAASGLDQMSVVHRPRLLSDNGRVIPRRGSRGVAEQAENRARPRRPLSPADPGQARALASDAQEPHPARALLPVRRSRTSGAAFVAHYNHARYTTMPAITRALGNLTPADVYFGRAETILLEREGSNDKQSPIVACSINCIPHSLNRRRSRASLLEASNMSQII